MNENKRMKRGLLTALFCLILLALFTLGASAQAETYGGTFGDQNQFTWTYDDSTKTLTISGQGDLPDFWDGCVVSSPWGYIGLQYAPDVVEQLIIEDGITSISRHLFGSYDQLCAIEMADSVLSVAADSFSGCSSLKSIHLSKNLCLIEEGAFYSCKSLTEIIIPAGVTVINDYTFYGCSTLKKVEFPQSLTSIGLYAFMDCTALDELHLPESLTSISEMAFYGCSSLSRITIPGSVLSIGHHAFASCSSLASVEILNGVSEIGQSCFSSCTNLSSISLPNSVNQIGRYAFYDCESLETIALPEGLTFLNPMFNNCFSLHSIYIPQSVTDMERSGFAYCDLIANAYYGGTEYEWRCNPISNRATSTAFFRRVTWHFAVSRADFLKMYPFNPYGGNEEEEEDGETAATITLKNAANSAIEAFTWNNGSFFFDNGSSSDHRSFTLEIAGENSNASILTGSYTLTLPDGFSFAADSIEKTKNLTFSGSEFSENFTVYPLFSASCPTSADFTLTGDVEETKSIAVTKNTSSGVVTCLATAGVNHKSSSITVSGLDKNPVTSFITSSVNSYSNDLSLMGCALSQAAYNEGYMTQSLKNLGYTCIETFGYGSATNDERSVACAMGVKTVVSGNGDVQPVLMLVIRGSFNKGDWIGNFMVAGGDSQTHANFQKAANDVLEHLKTYFTQYGLATQGMPASATRMYISGHSRGAAVANLVAEKLSSDNYFKGLTAYTFATPNVTKSPKSCSNIFNYVYYSDVVGFLPAEYSKHGVTIVMGSNGVPSDVLNKINGYCGRTDIDPDNDYLIAFVLGAKDDLDEFASTFSEELGSFLSKATGSDSPVGQAHGAENYLSWVQVKGGSGSTTFSTAVSMHRYNQETVYNSVRGAIIAGKVANILLPTSKVRLLANAISLMQASYECKKGAYMMGVSCPVDVNVYNANGVLVAQYVDHRVVSYNSDYVMAVSIDETDLLMAPRDQALRFEIVGTGEGTMNIGAALFTDELTSAGVNYYQGVPVETGAQFSLNIGANTSANQIVLLDGEGKPWQSKSVTLCLEPGQSIQLPAALFGMTEISGLSSSDSAILAVEEGHVVSAKKAGKATLTVSGEGTQHYMNVSVQVADLKNALIPSALSRVEAEAFAHTGASRIDLSKAKKLQSIESLAFADAASLWQILFPAGSGYSISSDAFEGSEQVLIICPERSAAHDFALENELNFAFPAAQ